MVHGVDRLHQLAQFVTPGGIQGDGQIAGGNTLCRAERFTQRVGNVARNAPGNQQAQHHTDHGGNSDTPLGAFNKRGRKLRLITEHLSHACVQSFRRCCQARGFAFFGAEGVHIRYQGGALLINGGQHSLGCGRDISLIKTPEQLGKGGDGNKFIRDGISAGFTRIFQEVLFNIRGIVERGGELHNRRRGLWRQAAVQRFQLMRQLNQRGGRNCTEGAGGLFGGSDKFFALVPIAAH